MSYSRTWTQSVPVSSNPANLIATYIQNVRGDVEERMAALVTGWTTASPTDPVVALPGISGKLASKHLIVPASSFVPTYTVGGVASPAVWAKDTNNSLMVNFPFGTNGQLSTAGFVLAAGAIIQNIQLMIYVIGTASASFLANYTSIVAGGGAGTVTQLGSTTNVSAGATIQLVSLTGNPFAHTVLDSTEYLIHVTANVPNLQSVRLYGALVTYDVDDSTQLI